MACDRRSENEQVMRTKPSPQPFVRNFRICPSSFGDMTTLRPRMELPCPNGFAHYPFRCVKSPCMKFWASLLGGYPGLVLRPPFSPRPERCLFPDMAASC